MALTDKDFIVAIELGSSKISAIAGKKKDGAMHIVAYAEEKTSSCIKRGVVFNMDKTYQTINSLIAKIEAVLKKKVKIVYVGISGQSVRSYRCISRRNMVTQSYITNEAVDGMRTESYDIPYADCEVLENFPQEFIIDQNIVADPVGVMGTNVEGEYLDIIAKQKLRSSIKTVFGNSSVDIADELISPLLLADNVLTDTEKRSGCALVDLGADTTTVVIYKNNIIRYLVTIPLGMNNINKDLATIEIEESEAEDIKVKYANLKTMFGDGEVDEAQVYTSSIGRKFDVSELQNIINARAKEIIANVSNQIGKSNYGDKLLAGIVLTGGGANMNGIDKAFLSTINADKVRIARSIIQPVVKTSDAKGFVADNCMTNTLLSLLMAADRPCCGGDYEGNDIFVASQQETERQERLARQAAELEAERNDAVAFDEKKKEIREEYSKVRASMQELENYGRDKTVRQKAREISLSALRVIGDSYAEAAAKLEGKDKFKQSLIEGSELAAKLKNEVEKLTAAVIKADKENSFWGRFQKTLKDMVEE